MHISDSDLLPKAFAQLMDHRPQLLHSDSYSSEDVARGSNPNGVCGCSEFGSRDSTHSYRSNGGWKGLVTERMAINLASSSRIAAASWHYGGAWSAKIPLTKVQSVPHLTR